VDWPEEAHFDTIRLSQNVLFDGDVGILVPCPGGTTPNIIIRRTRTLLRIRLTCRGTYREEYDSHPKPSAVRVAIAASFLTTGTKGGHSHATD
jgi:hypothetical protein